MIQIDKALLDELFAKAEASDRKRMNYDLRTSAEDKSQRMLNALLPGSCVPIHRHPMSNENVILLCGKLVEILYDSEGNETERYKLDPSVGSFGCVVPAGVWHTVEVLEPSVIYEAKDGAYGQDGSESFEEYKKKIQPQNPDKNALQFVASKDECLDGSPSARNPNQNLNENLKNQITYLIGMERQSGSMDNPSALYISRMLNVPLEEVEKVLATL